MKVVVHIRSGGGVVYHRLLRPFQLLKEQGLNVEFMPLKVERAEYHRIMEGATHYVCSRFIGLTGTAEIYKFVESLRANGIKLIVDNDDDWEIPTWNPAHDRYHKQGLTHAVADSLRFADEVWTTQKYLRDKIVKHLNTNTYIVPNGICATDEQWTNHDLPTEAMRYGYLGMSSHLEDLKSTGLDLTGKESYITAFEGYKETVNAMHYFDKKDVDTYGNLYRQIDVALIPLLKHNFNKCKSNLKMLEAGFAKKACIVSNVPPYSADIKPGINCVAVGSKQDWNKAVDNLSHNQAVDIAESLHEYVQKYELNKVNEIRKYRIEKLL